MKPPKKKKGQRLGAYRKECVKYVEWVRSHPAKKANNSLRDGAIFLATVNLVISGMGYFILSSYGVEFGFAWQFAAVSFAEFVIVILVRS